MCVKIQGTEGLQDEGENQKAVQTNQSDKDQMRCNQRSRSEVQSTSLETLKQSKNKEGRMVEMVGETFHYIREKLKTHTFWMD